MSRSNAIARMLALAGALLVSSYALSSYAENPPVPSSANETGPGEFQVQKHNPEMKRAVQEARQTVKTFIAALQHPGKGDTNFEVKKRFQHNNVSEHVWLSDVQYVGNRFEGRVDNDPKDLPNVKIGELVSVNPNEISDWAYVSNGKLVGGYTIRVHYKSLSPEEKAKFDKDVDFRIED